MEKWAYILISLSLFMLVIIIGLLSVLIYKLFKNQSASQASNTPLGNQDDQSKANMEFHPAILERMNDMKKVKAKRMDLFCPNHTEEPGETTCAICEKLFCKSCVKDFKSLHFCKEHLPLIMNFEWDEVFTIKTSTHDPEQGVRLYDIKKDLFEKEDLATYVETHYKINVDQDHIETYLVVYAQRDNVQKVRLIIQGKLSP
jgi:hypothetical protein